LHAAKKFDIDLKVIKAAVEANNIQTNLILQKLYKLLKAPVAGKTITVLGLAFKGEIDDVRCSPALKIIDELLEQGAHIKAYDPKAMENAKKLYPQIEYCPSFFTAAEGSEALMLLTDWREFKNLDLDKLHDLMTNNVFIDARNMMPIQKLIEAGFRYENVGRTNIGD
jgi:UDPglucose 6-dehydrogenase